MDRSEDQVTPAPGDAILSLGPKQRLFVRLVSGLIMRIYDEGYEATFGEAWRPPETAAAYAAQGKGIVNSLHIVKLAIDLNLFHNGIYLADTESHRVFGEWWEKRHALCRWGGRFKDGNHYSLAHEGRA